MIAFLKRYFEKVRQWTRNKRHALVAPMNAMADNIGSSTAHSFGRIPIEDRRDTLIQSSDDGKPAGMSGSPDYSLQARGRRLDDAHRRPRI